ncbi:hypothetical protein GO009_02580 [Muricauda sp. TY007]|uniref:hypothetical protein n=1 Tax=Allomuricauda sp. TY007 TaxID=2683200 RepID=UPI0013C1F60D|nr:hypothetical protein [Muricauda sp. TY007]NDV14899.1 hypothetical protein [Muricauda sp. TY007]
MKLKTLFIACISFGLLIPFTSCNNYNSKEDEQFDAKNTLAQLNNLLIQLNGLDTVDCQNLDEIVTINEKIRGIIESIRSTKKFDSLATTYNKAEHQIGFVVSDNQQFGVFSWETKMDCMGHNIKNIALYKSKNRIVASSLYGKPMIYHGIISKNQGNGKTIYLLNGRFSSKKKHFNTTTKAYTITNGSLAESQIPLLGKLHEGYATTEFEQ